MIRLILFIAAAALLFLSSGINEIRASQVHERPKNISLTQLTSQKPNDGYFTIRGGVLDLFQAGKKHVTVDNTGYDEYYVPLIQPTDDPLTAKSHVLIAVSDPNLIKTIDDEVALPDHPTAAQRRDFWVSHKASLLIARDVTGHVTSEKYATLALSLKGVNIAQDAVAIQEGIDKPASWTYGLEEIIFGSFLAVVAMLMLFFKFRVYRTGNDWVPTTFAPPSQPNPQNGNAGQPSSGSSAPSNSEPAWWDKPGG